MDQSRGSAVSSNLLSAPLHPLLCWTGRCELWKPSHHAKFKPRRRERSELKTGLKSHPFAIEGRMKAGKRRRNPFFFVSRLERCSQCTAIRTQTLDQAGTGDQSSIDSSISNREKTESRRGQLSSKGVAGRRLGALAGNETKASHWSTRPSAKFQLYVDKKKENPLRRGLSTIPKERGN